MRAHGTSLAVLAALIFGCTREVGVAANRAAQSPAAPAPPSAAAPVPEAEEACVDRWLAARKLDAYGSPEGTMYSGGTPLLDESTGKTISRLDYVYSKHPEAKPACSSGVSGEGRR